MIEKLTMVTILVRDQDEALRWYTEKLGFEKKADDSGTIPGFRWLTVAPRNQQELEIVLQQPGPPFHDQETTEKLIARVGQATTSVLRCDNCQETYKELVSRGVEFKSPPSKMPWGTSAVFVDLYGNPLNLIEPR